MATQTTVYSFDKPAVGGDVGTWGALLNTNFDDLDSELARTRQPFNSPAVGATTTMDLSLARLFAFTVNQATTLAFTNVPSSSYFVRWWAVITNGAAFAVTHPASVTWLSGGAPTFQVSGVDVVEYVTLDGGTTIYGIHHGKIARFGSGNAVGYLARQHTDVGTGAATTETTLFTATVPGRTMGANGALRVRLAGLLTGTNDTKTVTLKYGGTSFVSVVYVAGTTGTFYFDFLIANRNATNSQIGNGVASDATTLVLTNSGFSTGVIDSTADKDVVITGTTPNAADEITLKTVTLEVLPT